MIKSYYIQSAFPSGFYKKKNEKGFDILSKFSEVYLLTSKKEVEKALKDTLDFIEKNYKSDLSYWISTSLYEIKFYLKDLLYTIDIGEKPYDKEFEDLYCLISEVEEEMIEEGVTFKEQKLELDWKFNDTFYETE